jgi:hypothetical protein
MERYALVEDYDSDYLLVRRLELGEIYPKPVTKRPQRGVKGRPEFEESSRSDSPKNTDSGDR